MMANLVIKLLRYDPKCSDVEIAESNLTMLNVGSRSCGRVSVHVHHLPSRLKWFFRCENGDIDFSIADADDEEVRVL